MSEDRITEIEDALLEWAEDDGNWTGLNSCDTLRIIVDDIKVRRSAPARSEPRRAQEKPSPCAECGGHFEADCHTHRKCFKQRHQHTDDCHEFLEPPPAPSPEPQGSTLTEYRDWNGSTITITLRRGDIVTLVPFKYEQLCCGLDMIRAAFQPEEKP